MAVVHRRVFYGKVGVADRLVAHVKEGYEQLNSLANVSYPIRIMTDFMSGRTDRVVVEVEAASIDEIVAAESKAADTPQGQTMLGPWMQELTEMIHYSEAENWTVQ